MTSARKCFYLLAVMFTGFAGIWKVNPFINFYVMLDLCTPSHNEIFLGFRGNFQAFQKEMKISNM